MCLFGLLNVSTSTSCLLVLLTYIQNPPTVLGNQEHYRVQVRFVLTYVPLYWTVPEVSFSSDRLCTQSGFRFIFHLTQFISLTFRPVEFD